MTDSRSSPRRRVTLVERDPRAGLVLERALAVRGWTVTRSDTGRVLSEKTAVACDTVLFVLDDDETDVFETLIVLSSLPRRPSVVLLTRRADTSVLADSVLTSLGVDRLLAWPCRIEQIEAALETAQRIHEPLRLVS